MTAPSCGQSYGLPDSQNRRRRAGRGNFHAGDRAQNLQDTFLNYVRKNKIPLTIFSSTV
jgi:hypothetical protein